VIGAFFRMTNQNKGNLERMPCPCKNERKATHPPRVISIPAFWVLSSLVVLIPFLVGCGTVEVRSAADSKADFSHFHTYSFTESAQRSDPRYFTVVNEARIKAAISREMEALSFQLADHPDLGICLFLQTAERTYDRSNPDSTGSFVSDLKRHYEFRYDEPWRSQPTAQFTEGSLVVRAVDTMHGRVVWETVATGVLHENRTDAQIEERIHEAISAMFKRFPNAKPNYGTQELSQRKD